MVVHINIVCSYAVMNQLKRIYSYTINNVLIVKVIPFQSNFTYHITNDIP